jgi:nitrogen-specific signal transduction histidine kinase
MHTPILPLQHEHRLLAVILLSLHASVWLHTTEWWGLLALGIHFFLLLFWQALHATKQSTQTKTITLLGLLLLTAICLVFYQLWLLVLWQCTLLVILAGRYFRQNSDKVASLIAIIFILLQLFLLELPELLAVTHNHDWMTFLPYLFITLLPISLLSFSASPEGGQRQTGTFLTGLLLVLVVLLIALGTVFLMQNSQLSYHVALFRVTLLSLLSLLLLSAVWALFNDVESLLSLWIKEPEHTENAFEQWLANLAQPSSYKALTPQQFLELGLQHLQETPWVCGIGWKASYAHGALGDEGKYKADYTVQSLEVTVYANRHIRSNAHAHMKLLVQILEYFHQAKRREEMLAQQAHLQAIHETGAKLTHDIKNLLQSLYAITSAIESAKPEHFGETQRLLQGQLPHLSQRLKRTLDKLKKPTAEIYSETPLRVWWENLNARYRKRHIQFSMSLMWNANIPEELFDNVVENILENALNKRKREPSLQIQVSIESSEQQILLTICDDGSAIPADIAQQLLNNPVPSLDGFGIGLYQAAKQVEQCAYVLRISHNEVGRVCFELSTLERNSASVNND